MYSNEQTQRDDHCVDFRQQPGWVISLVKTHVLLLYELTRARATTFAETTMSVERLFWHYSLDQQNLDDESIFRFKNRTVILKILCYGNLKLCK